MENAVYFTRAIPRRRAGLALTVLSAVLLGASPSYAADDILIDNFDTDTAGQWTRWWGAAQQTYEWDSTVDASNNVASGALKVTVQFDLATHTGDNQFASQRGFPVTEGSQYTNLVFDLLWDQSSPRRTSDFGFLEPGFRNSDFSQNWLPGFAVSTNPGWMRITLPINPTAPKIDTINGVVLKMWSGGAGGFTGPAVFWVDNVRLVARADINDPPPTLSMEAARPGLTLAAIGSGQYDRHSIRTASPEYSWVGAVDPVTYSITIKGYPDRTHSDFQTHLFIVPGSAIPTFENGPDWNQPHVVFLHIGNNADGTAYAAFRYKTNQPNGNTMLYNEGTLAVVSSSSPIGTWNLTFNPGGDITLTSPSGGMTNFAMPPEAVALFAGPAYAYIGVQPNQLANRGQAALLDRIQITGVATPIDETFPSATLDPRWQIIAPDASAAIPVPPDAAFWISWTLPDRDYVMKWADDIEFPAELWSDFPVTGVQVGGEKRALILQSQLPQSLTGRTFFMLVKP